MPIEKRVTVRAVLNWKAKPFAPHLSMLTAYDYTTARIATAAGVPLILVGDSLGMTTMGLDSTIGVRLKDIIFACQAVRRAVQNSLVIADMPFMATEPNAEKALINAAKLVQDGGADAVKLEGGANAPECVAKIVGAGIPVMGHLGLKPQTIKRLGRYAIVGKNDTEIQQKLVKESELLAEAGAFALVLELVDANLARTITAKLEIPTIGIGSGKDTDGQVQVFHDLVGLTPKAKSPKHAAIYLDADTLLQKAISEFVQNPTAKIK